ETYPTWKGRDGSGRAPSAVGCFTGCDGRWVIGRARTDSCNVAAWRRVTLLFPFNRGRRFGAYIIDHAVYSTDFIYNPATDSPQHLRRKRKPIRRHPIPTRHRPQRDHVIVRAEVSHHADRLDREQHREGLPDLVV